MVLANPSADVCNYEYVQAALEKMVEPLCLKNMSSATLLPVSYGTFIEIVHFVLAPAITDWMSGARVAEKFLFKKLGRNRVCLQQLAAVFVKYALQYY